MVDPKRLTRQLEALKIKMQDPAYREQVAKHEAGLQAKRDLENLTKPSGLPLPAPVTGKTSPSWFKWVLLGGAGLLALKIFSGKKS